jgi:rubrerythrin
MANIFSGSEIVEIGVQIEKNGKDFYETVAGQAKDKKVKDIFLFLAAEEAKHMLVFQKILSQVEKYEPAEAYPGEYFSYMNALAGESVFTQKDKGREIAKKMKSDKEAIEIGINAEKDSIVFYEGVKKVVPVYDHAVIDEVIVQEQGHLKQLLELKERI